MILGIVVFVVGIFVMIFVHELGHYLAAKRYGIKVDEFFLGFGPRLWSFRRGETEYGVKAIPLGGYVRIAGMNPFEEVAPEDRDRVFTAKPKRQRAVVLVAGATTHFVLAFLLLLALFWVVGVPFSTTTIAAVRPSIAGEPSPASSAGLQAGDRIVRVDGRRVEAFAEAVEIIRASPGEPLSLVVVRDGRSLELEVTPTAVASEVDPGVPPIGLIGVEAVVARDRLGPIEGVVQSGRIFGRLVVGSFEGMGRAFGPEGIGRVAQALFGGEQRTVQDPVGIVGAGRVAGQAVESGQVDAFLTLFAFFNVFVGILNLMPLPPLDGGHLAVLGIEAATRRRIDPRRLIPITAVVAGFLILFTVSLLYLDVVQPIPNPFE